MLRRVVLLSAPQHERFELTAGAPDSESSAAHCASSVMMKGIVTPAARASCSTSRCSSRAPAIQGFEGRVT